MKVLFIGGTGNISTSTSKLAVERGIDLYLINRGTRNVDIPGAKTLIGDISNLAEMKKLLNNHEWDVVVNWIAFEPKDIERDFELFHKKTKQYIFLSSASAYQKPPIHPVITESTPLKNPFWQYSRDKIACEDLLNTYYRNNDFPITIVRPSLTYSSVIPVVFGGWNEYTIIDRIKKGQKIIVHGDGTSLWTITHADDFAKGFIGLIGHQQTIGHSFHITSDEILTWNQIYENVAKAVNASANIIHIPSDFLGTFSERLRGSLLGDKAQSVIFDNSKIKLFVPDFVATIPFEEGIKRTVNWFEAEPSRMVINPESNKLMDEIIAKYENN
ncbi:MAG: SDR family oxidoreductase [Reichenbachiella sp.]